MRKRLIIAVVTLLLVGVVYAQQPVNVVNTALHTIIDSGVVTSITNTVTVSGTVTATGPLTDTQLRATAVPISGTVTATGPLTDNQLRATPVPVSGTVTTGGLTDTQLRASAVPISISSGSIANTTFASTQGTSPWVVAGGGTAGTAASGVLTVQGIASMTKLLVTPDSVALPANQSTNVAQINAVTPLMGIGLSGTGSLRNTEAADNPILGNALSTSPLTVVNAASTLTYYYCYNPNTVVSYIQIFDSSSVSLGSTTPKLSLGIPALTAKDGPMHSNFTNSIKAAATTTATGSSAPSTAIDCNFSYE